MLSVQRLFYTPSQPIIHYDPVLERVAAACVPFIGCSLSEMGDFFYRLVFEIPTF